jgi:YfiH family protein
MTLPPPAAAFRWTAEPWGAALRCRPLEALAPHVFATRQLEASEAGYRQLAAALGASQVASLTQVHGSAVVVIRPDGPWSGEAPEADALISRDPATAIAVRAADCVPILMADRVTGAVAAIHAGWRGTASAAATAALAALAREFGTRSADVIAAIGPSIGPCCYEVGSELVDAFAAAGHARHLIDRWFSTPRDVSASRAAAEVLSRRRSERPALRLDVAGANRDQLVLAGVPEAQVYLSGLCTAMHLEVLTSYRAEKERAGRLIAAIRARASRR